MSAYRDDLQAAHLRVESLETELEDEQLRAQSLRGELDEVRQEKFVDLEDLVARVHRLEQELETLRGDPSAARQRVLEGKTSPGPHVAPRKRNPAVVAIIAGLGGLVVAVGLATVLVLRASSPVPAPSPTRVGPPAVTEQVEVVPQTAPATGELEQADIQKVVSEKIPSIKRQCWEPALATRSATSPSGARVSVLLTIGADGSVQSATASGGVGYPDLGNCVVARVRTWKFPASSGASTANIPFVFASQ